jgi:hypothetical protein
MSDEHTLNGLLEGLKQRALEYGRFPTPYTAERYDIRKTLGNPFRCMGQINALERLLSKPDNRPLAWNNSCQYISSNGCIHMDWTKSSAYVAGGTLCYTKDCPLVK